MTWDFSIPIVYKSEIQIRGAHQKSYTSAVQDSHGRKSSISFYIGRLQVNHHMQGGALESWFQRSGQIQATPP